jgi:hypothetical protein
MSASCRTHIGGVTPLSLAVVNLASLPHAAVSSGFRGGGGVCGCAGCPLFGFLGPWACWCRVVFVASCVVFGAVPVCFPGGGVCCGALLFVLGVGFWGRLLW